MAKPLFHGVCASSITPFGQQGALDLGRLGPHLDWLIGEGVDAISPLGSSGEFVAMECEDRKKVLASAIEKIAGRVHVVAGTHDYSTRRTIDLSKFAESHGADSLLIVPPYYMAPTPTQVMDHYRRIAEAVSIPIVLYHNIPLTAVDLKTDHLLKLYEEKAIGGIKMSNPEPDRICEILQATHSKLHIYAGIDTVAFEGLCHGAHGWISGIPSTVPRAAKELYVAIAVEKNLDKARLLWTKLAPLMRLQFQAYHSRGEGAHWFSTMKAGLNMIGPPVGDPEPPIAPLPASLRETLAQLLRDLGYKVQS
ncbi:MAG: dihydrodipicolinate synthase family protein [Planctomycetota bacterium]|jgi:4-hydroxy-tetrahydrodipicolinate synthase